VVILMGLGRLTEIMTQFEAHGKGNIPVAVIQNGTLPQQQSVIGTVGSIATQAADAGIGAPAIIIVGEVVRYARALEHVVVATKSMA
jgi:uroporphyrin-III C-methyltransferase